LDSATVVEVCTSTVLNSPSSLSKSPTFWKKVGEFFGYSSASSLEKETLLPDSNKKFTCN
jgi:hypothetical protein